MAESYYFGHKIEYDFNNKEWLWADNHKTVQSEKRKCPRCNCLQTKKGYDPCIGYVKNAVSVCCGHGVTEPILMF